MSESSANVSYENIIPMLRRFAYSLTGSKDDADDLVQATFEKILNKGIPENVEAVKWAFKVCRNVWIDEYRAQKVRQKATQAPELQEQIVDPQSAPHESHERMAKVNAAMGNLPDDQRSILSLVALKGMSYKEVAAISGIPVGTVMSRLSRARTSLLDMLEPQTAGQNS